MEEARRWADHGAPHGALVLAEEQTAGRGRRGRRWIGAHGKNLLMTLVLRPKLPEERLSLISLLAGLAIAEACESLVAQLVRIKWPNDVLIDDRKVAGVLTEQKKQHGNPLILLGIGLNVNQVDFDESAAPNATSLALEFGSPIPRSQVLTPVLRSLEWWLLTLEDEPSAVTDAINRRLAFRGERRIVEHPAPRHEGGIQGHFGGAPQQGKQEEDEKLVEGIVRDVSNDGSLRMETPDGDVFIYAGDVEQTQTRSE